MYITHTRKNSEKCISPPRVRSQSAMEYLMTYGWAILIIAVVLAALFELGVFNPMTFAPKASPGSCQVIRPEGAGTTNFMSIEGECNGEIPQYVAAFTTGPITIHNPSENSFPNGYTMTAWVKYVNPITECGYVLGIENVTHEPRGGLVLSCSGLPSPYAESINQTGVGVSSPNPTLNYGQWYFMAADWNPANSIISLYIDGVFYNGSDTISPTSMIMNGPNYYYVIGGQNTVSAWNGYIADAQLYNTALSANGLKALYQEGIGGAPIKIQNLVGWWPLNGNAQDYSGNNNNGQATGVTYSGSWTNGYTAP